MPITSEPKGPKPPFTFGVKVQLIYSGSAGGLTFNAANVLHLLLGGGAGITTTTLSTLAGQIRAAFGTRFASSISSEWTLIQTILTLTDGTGVQGTDSTHVVGTGAVAYPPQCAVCITWKGAIGWRGGRPRTYLPGVPSSATAGSVGSAALSSSFTAPLATAAQNFISDVNALTIAGNSVTLGLISYYSKGAFRIPPIFIPFQTAVVHDRLDSQRRRSGKERTYSID